jgi:hypothetical protein
MISIRLPEEANKTYWVLNEGNPDFIRLSSALVGPSTSIERLALKDFGVIRGSGLTPSG